MVVRIRQVGSHHYSVAATEFALPLMSQNPFGTIRGSSCDMKPILCHCSLGMIAEAGSHRHHFGSEDGPQVW